MKFTDRINACHNRNEATKVYADMIAVPMCEEVWAVNNAIVEKWSKSGLRWIKEKAWKLYGTTLKAPQ